MNPVIKTFQFGESTITLETGRIARQATGSVLVSVNNDVTVLCTVVGAKKPTQAKTFPLSVHYQEKPMLQVKFQVVSSSVKRVHPKRNPDFAIDRPSDSSAVPRRFQ